MEAVKELIHFENLRVEIWRRPYQRSLNLRVRAQGLVRVTCGRSVSRCAILDFVRESRTFIDRCQSELAETAARFPEKRYVSDEIFMFFGEEWPLEVVWTWEPRVRVQPLERRLEMLAPLSSTLAQRRRAMHAFYRRQARMHLEERIAHFAARMDLRPAKVSVRGQRTRWGSCTTEGKISLNWKLLAAPEWVIDYVVVHELAHLKHMNHSPRFWDLVGAYHPDPRSARRWLRENEPALARQFSGNE
jgi:predicted metal-dependent hydrolase